MSDVEKQPSLDLEVVEKGLEDSESDSHSSPTESVEPLAEYTTNGRVNSLDLFEFK